ncbi:MAG TPA: glycosyl hydrolase family 28-related protein, partial [Candidatus Binatia bacterium]|nr:glycosyl hydrolase family 28-related protein [Candidatus Binatia bacterium]
MPRLAVILALVLSLPSAHAFSGATVPWTTYEAENMTINGGQILGPPQKVVDNNAPATNTVDMEASGRQCVRLTAAGQYVQFAAQATANAMVVRYSVPDTANGTGTNYTLSLYTNGTFLQKVPMTSKYSWVYGSYSFNNTPNSGTPRNFYDEARLSGLTINPGDLIRLQVDTNDTATNYDIDLVDLENVAAPLSAPSNSVSVMSYGATGNGTTDDTAAISNCVAHGGLVWVPPGTYLVSGDINVPGGTTVQGAGMWYTTFVGDPAKYNIPSTGQHMRVRFNGGGNGIHLADFAIIGKLNNRTDSEINDGLVNWYGSGSTISRIWVEHTKTGAWLYNSSGLIVDSCRFRDTIADGINLNVGMLGTIVTNCTTRGTGDDCFAMWPAPASSVGIPQIYTPGFNVFTHCTAQVPFFANGGGIYGAVSNRIEDCFFQDIPYGAGVLINGTYPVGPYVFSGQTVVQRCDLNRCGGYDPGWQWRGSLALDAESLVLTNLFVNNLTISNSLSYAVKIISRNGQPMSNSLMSNVVVSAYGLADPSFHPQPNYVDGVFGVWAGNGANGNLTVSGLVVNGNAITSYPGGGPDDITNQATGFTFIIVTNSGATTVGTSPAGLSFTVDGTNYSTAQTFNWIPGSPHTIATTGIQAGGAGTQYVWSAWSDGGALSHTVSPTNGTNYTATFTTQYRLTMNAGPDGNVTPGSLWTNSGANLNISATASNGYSFTSWTGSGSGSYSGPNNPASLTMNGPITQTAGFVQQVQAMAFVQQPGNVFQGSTLSPEVQVQAFNISSQPISNALIALSLGSGTGTLAGTLQRSTDANGIAHFNDLSLNQLGPKILTATALTGSAPPTNSSPFMVIGPAVALAFTTQPGSALAGIPFGQQPVLETVDAFGNPTTLGLPASDIFRVVLTNSSGNLLGTTSYDIGTSGSNGVVAFTDLAIDTAGSGDQLVASKFVAVNPVSGAVLWLDASDPATLTTNGTRVQAWENKGSGGAGPSGTNLWFTQNTTTLQPWLTNQLNGRPVVTFNKNGSGYSAGCTYLGNIGHNSYTNSGSQMSYFVVARQSENTIGWQGPVSFSTNRQTDGQGTGGVVILT